LFIAKLKQGGLTLILNIFKNIHKKPFPPKLIYFTVLQQGEDDASDTAGQGGDMVEREGNSDSNSDDGNSGDESGDEKPAEKAVSTVDEEEEEAEWERFQKRITKYVYNH
jgi:hypothetical protein